MLNVKNAELVLYLPYETPIIEGEEKIPSYDGIYTYYSINIEDNKKLEEVNTMFLENKFNLTKELYKEIIVAWVGLKASIDYCKEKSLTLNVGNILDNSFLNLEHKFKIIFVQK